MLERSRGIPQQGGGREGGGAVAELNRAAMRKERMSRLALTCGTAQLLCAAAQSRSDGNARSSAQPRLGLTCRGGDAALGLGLAAQGEHVGLVGA